MLPLYYPVFVAIFASFLLASVEGIDFTFVKQVVCGNLHSDQQCNNCFVKSKIVPSNHTESESLVDYFHYVKLNFKSNESRSISWKFQDFPHINPSHVKVTLTIWDDKTNRALPVPGCCSVPLSFGQCRLSSCMSSSNQTALTLSYKQMNLMKTISVPKTSLCKTNRSRSNAPTVRYFSICSEEQTSWRMRYNCECAVYDSNTGHFLPGNHSTQIEKETSEGGLWFFDDNPESYQVCVFAMKKDDVMKRGAISNDSSVMDSVVFNRGVFYMEGFACGNGSVFDQMVGKNINCSFANFRGSDIFNISSSDISVPEMKADNDSFTCVVPWLNGSQGMRPLGAHVKCMPQNQTFPMMSHVYTMNTKKRTSFVDAMVIFVPLFGGVASLAIVCFLALTLRKKYNKFIKDTKKVPEELSKVMKEHTNFFNGKTDFFSNDQKEKCQAFDREERQLILSIRSKNGTIARDKRGEFLQNDCNSLQAITNNNQHFDIVSNENSTRTSKQTSENEIEKDFKFERHEKFSNHEQNDSGCPSSISSNSIRSYKSDTSSNVSSEVPYCLHQVADYTRHDNDKFFSRSLISLENDGSAIGIDQIPSNGYWSKEPFETSSAKNRFSHCSDDTGCESACEDIDDGINNFVFVHDSTDGKKHPFIKTVSKDSGVVTDDFRTNSIESLSDVSEETEIDLPSIPVSFSGGRSLAPLVW